METIRKTRSLIPGIILGLTLFTALCLGGCDEDSSSPGPSAPLDPLMQQAENNYTEARRLFLTCSPENYPKSIELYQKALTYDEDYPEALAGLAEAVSMYFGFNLPEKQYQQAYGWAQRSIRLKPESDMGYRAMADLYRHHRNPKTGQMDINNALEVIEKALLINPDSAENLYVKGSIYLQNDPEKAIRILIQALNQNPDLAKIYFNLASAHQMRAEQLASQNITDPIKKQENDKLVEAHRKKAIEYLTTYQGIVPDDLAAYASMGNLYLQLEDFEKAEQAYKKTMSANPNPDQSQQRWRLMALHQLSFIYQNQKKDLKGAREFVEIGMEMAPMNRELLGRAIELSELMGDQAAVEKYQTRIKQILMQMQNSTAPSPAPGGTPPEPEEPEQPSPDKNSPDNP